MSRRSRLKEKNMIYNIIYSNIKMKNNNTQKVNVKMKNLIMDSLEKEPKCISLIFKMTRKKGKFGAFLWRNAGGGKYNTKSFISTQMILISIKINGIFIIRLI